MTKLICLGEIVAAHGIKGQVKIKTFTSDAKSITKYGKLTDATETNSYIIKSARVIGNQLIIASLADINTRNEAETLIGVKFHILRSQLPETQEGEYYHTDLLDLLVLNQDGIELGKVLGLQDFGAGTFFDIQPDQDSKVITVPFNKDAIIEINLNEGKIIVDQNFVLI